MMPLRRWILAVVIGLAWLGRLVAAERTGFSVQHWSTDTGLPPRTPPQNSIIAMTQTREGYLWLGTLNGLARFDGREFKVFDQNNLPQLGSGRVVFLFADSYGGLWVGTEASGAVLIKRGQVTPLDQFVGRGRAARLTAACEGTNGVVWLCTADGKLARYTEGDLSYLRLPTDPARLGEYRSLVLDDGRLWIGAQGRLMAFELAAISPGKDLPREQIAIPMNVDLLVPSARGGFWLLAGGKVQRLHGQAIERDFGAYPWSGVPVFSACEDRAGNLVVGTRDRGLFWFDAEGGVENLTSPGVLTHNTVLSLHADSEGSLWVGTDGRGLSRLKRQAFTVQPASSGEKIESVCADGDGGIWFAVDNRPLRHWHDGRLEEFGLAAGLPKLEVRSVLVDRRKVVWAGTEHDGLFQWVSNSFRSTPIAGRLPTAVTALHEDRTGRVIAGMRDGIAIWDGAKWEHQPVSAGFGGGDVRALADDAQGNLWIGTDGGGLHRWNHAARSATAVHVADGLPSEQVSALLVDREGMLWVGTPGNGLARYDGHGWTRYSTDDGLISNSIGYLLEDDAGNLWIGSTAGLMRAAQSDLNSFAADRAAGKLTRLRCRTYGREEGLPTNEGSTGGQPMACRTTHGMLWFATISGLAGVNPAAIMPNTNPPPVMIEEVLVDDVVQNTNRLRLNWPEEVTIPAGRERLEIRYTSLNLLAPERARFKYQLEGYENGWTEAGDTRVAHYNKLPANQYRFRVIAGNEDDVWSEVGASLTVIVLPPFWQTWWFLTLSGVVLLGAIVGTVHFISTQKLQRQLATMRQQEALEKERARIARDLHDQLGANLTQVSLLAEMAESDKELPEEVAAHAQQITATARETSNALDQIVWAANPANDTLDSLVTYACKYAQEYFQTAGLSYRLEAPEQLPATPLPPDVRHNVFLAFKESVNNVVKHAQASAAKVRVRLAGGQFTIEIEDNGRGLPPGAEKKGRNGLRNMRKRMEDVGGEFAVTPAPEQGTLVRLTAPISKRIN